MRKRFYPVKKVFLTLEGKVTASYAITPVQGGSAETPNIAFHGLLGIGFDY
jgi:hypothetical protein